MVLPSCAVPSTEQQTKGADPLSKRLVSGPWFSCPVPAGSALCFFLLLAAGVVFQLPAGGTSGQTSFPFRLRAPTPRTGFFRYLPTPFFREVRACPRLS